MKKLFIFSILILVLIGCVFAQNTDEEKKVLTPEEISKDYGHNIGKLLEDMKKNPGVFESIDSKSFIEGYKASKEENREKKLMELFGGQYEKQGKKVGYISDEFKNKIWQEVVVKDAKKYLLILADSKFKERYKGIDISGLKDPGIKDIQITEENAKKLSWVGDSLMLNEKGKQKVWVDFANIPRWMESIRFDGEKFSCDFNLVQLKKTIEFSGGTIGFSGELVAPNGKKVGSAFGNYLQSIKFNPQTRALTAEYNVNGQTRKIELTEAMLKANLPGDMLSKYNQAFTDPKIGPMLQKFLEDSQQFNLDLQGGTGGLGFPADNQLNLLYFYTNSKEAQKIDIKFDDKGRPEILATKGSTFVTTNSKGEARVLYEGASGNSGGEGKFKFDAYGDIYATQNSKIREAWGDFMAPVNNEVGVTLIKNSYLKEIGQGDEGVKRLYETFLKENDIFRKAIKDPTFNINNELTSIARRELDNSDFKTELLTQLSKLTDTFVASSESLTDGLFTEVFGRGPGVDIAKEAVLSDIKSNVYGAVEKIASNPDEITKVIGMNPDQRKEYLRTKIQEQINNPALNGYVTGSLVDSISGGVGNVMEAVKIKSKDESVSDVVRKTLGQEVDKLFTASSNSGQDSGDNVKAREKLLESGLGTISGNSEKDKQAVSATVNGFVSEIKKIAEVERDKFLKSIKEGNTPPSYEQRVVIDHKLHEISLVGGEMTYDTRVPLNKFSVNNPSGKDVWIFSNGNPVASINGDKVMDIRNKEVKEYSSIAQLINERTPGTDGIFRLATITTKEGTGYQLFNPAKTMVVGSYTQPGEANKKVWIMDINVPFIASQSEVQGPQAVDWDIGSDPNAKVVVTNVAKPTAKGMLGGIKNSQFEKEMLKKYPEGKPLSEDIVPNIQKQVDGQIADFKSKMGANYEGYIKGNLEMFNEFDKLGVSGVPGMSEVKDMLTIANDPSVMYNVLNFMGQQKLPQGAAVEFTNTYISVNGKKYGVENGANPAAFRTLLRNIRKDPSQLYAPMTVKASRKK